jgi:hypothetical protein
MRTRRNPNIEKCPDRMQELMRIFSNDLSIQREILVDKLNYLNIEKGPHELEYRFDKRKSDLWKYLPSDYGEGLKGYCGPSEFINAALEVVQFNEPSMEDLQNIAEGMSSTIQLRHYVPPYFGQKIEAELNKPFFFIHFTSSEGATRILREGFRGRIRKEDLFSTRKGQTTEYGSITHKLGSGFIYAYLLQAQTLSEVHEELQAGGSLVRTDEEGYSDYAQAVSSVGVIARAHQGLLVFHKMDDEMQVIIPVECIEDTSLAIVDTSHLGAESTDYIIYDDSDDYEDDDDSDDYEDDDDSEDY